MNNFESLKKDLSELQFKVLCQSGTEPAFQNEYWNHKEVGLYVDRISGVPLFRSSDKYDSHSGWPSFIKPIGASAVTEHTDTNHGMVRVEVKSHSSQGHLGHVFDDGPTDRGGLRYCINSASLKFVALEELVQLGLQDHLPEFQNELAGADWALLGAGCFWGVEELLRKIPGILDIDVGYAGGEMRSPTYEVVKKGTTQHAEVVLIKYQSSLINYSQILDLFFKLHDPTTKDRQAGDVGTQYRSCIFYKTEGERDAAQAAIARVNQSGKWQSPVVTEVSKWTRFWKAEDYHQDYLQKNPSGYMCHYWREG